MENASDIEAMMNSGPCVFCLSVHVNPKIRRHGRIYMIGRSKNIFSCVGDKALEEAEWLER